MESKNGHDVRKEVERLLAPMGTIFLSTNGENGFPETRAMSPTKTEGLKTLWLLTSSCCDKHRELSADPRCTIYATDLEDTDGYLELRLRGTVKILDDAESRSLAWVDAYRHYFPGGKDDPTLRILKFTATSGTIQTPEGKQHFDL